MATIAAARTALRSFRSTATRLASGSKPKMPSTSPFRTSSQKPLSARILRSPMEMSFAVESMLPYHTATASALLNSMLSVTPQGYGWTIEDCNDDV